MQSRPHQIDFHAEHTAIKEIKHVGRLQSAQARKHALTSHSHDDAFELCYIKAGMVTWWVGNEYYDLAPGSCYLTWPNETHGGMDDTIHPSELYWIIFQIPEKGRFLCMSQTDTRALRQRFFDLKSRSWSGGPHIARHFDRILDEHRYPTQLSATAIRSSMTLLLLDALNAAESTENNDQVARTRSLRIREAITWMDAQIGQSYSMEEAANRAGLKLTRFREVFREETGVSPKNYINRLRIRKARLLLANTEKPITEIAFELGYSSSQHFATDFRKMTSLMPKEYRAASKP